MAHLDSYNFRNEDLRGPLILSATCSENDSGDSEWCLGAKHEGSDATDSDGIFLDIKVFRGSFLGSHLNTIYMLSCISHVVN